MKECSLPKAYFEMAPDITRLRCGPRRILPSIHEGHRDSGYKYFRTNGRFITERLCHKIIAYLSKEPFIDIDDAKEILAELTNEKA